MAMGPILFNLPALMQLCMALAGGGGAVTEAPFKAREHLFPSLGAASVPKCWMPLGLLPGHRGFRGSEAFRKAALPGTETRKGLETELVPKQSLPFPWRKPCRALQPMQALPSLSWCSPARALHGLPAISWKQE